MRRRFQLGHLYDLRNDNMFVSLCRFFGRAPVYGDGGDTAGCGSKRIGGKRYCWLIRGYSRNPRQGRIYATGPIDVQSAGRVAAEIALQCGYCAVARPHLPDQLISQQAGIRAIFGIAYHLDGGRLQANDGQNADGKEQDGNETFQQHRAGLLVRE